MRFCAVRNGRYVRAGGATALISPVNPKCIAAPMSAARTRLLRNQMAKIRRIIVALLICWIAIRRYRCMVLLRLREYRTAISRITRVFILHAFVFAFAAIAATQATVTKVVFTRILRAVFADACGDFSADCATKRRFHQPRFRFPVVGQGGALLACARHRCASSSAILKLLFRFTVSSAM